MEPSSYNSLLAQIHPSLRNFILEIWTHGNCGIGSANILVSQPISTNSEKYANRFTLYVPFAAHFLEWVVTFNEKDYSKAPKFYLGDDITFGDSMSLEMQANVPSLKTWDANSPQSLIKLVKEFHAVYNKEQINALKDDALILYVEYISLIEDFGIDHSDIEVLTGPSGEVHFLIALPIDFSGIQLYHVQTEKTASLMITFHRADGGYTKPLLFLSPYVEQALGGTKPLPNFLIYEPLLDYVQEVQKLLTDEVDKATHYYNRITLGNTY